MNHGYRELRRTIESLEAREKRGGGQLFSELPLKQMLKIFLIAIWNRKIKTKLLGKKDA